MGVSQVTDQVVIPQGGSELVVWLFEVDGVVRDFTLWEGRIQIREQRSLLAEVLIDLSVANGLLVLTHDGRVEADFTIDEVVKVAAGSSCVGELCLVDPQGNVSFPIRIEFESPAVATEAP